MSDLNRIDNWQIAAAYSTQNRAPIVVMVDQANCEYCHRVEGEFLAALIAGGDWQNRALFGKISIDPGETIINGNGVKISTREFLKQYNANFTPTILYLDSDLNELSEKLIGLSTPDYYGFYLEKGIRTAYKKLNG